jgi:chromosome segregation ATPase
MKSKSLVLKTIISVVLILGGATFLTYGKTWFSPKPCTEPIAFSIGTFDPKFGISQEKFLSDVEKATEIWEGPTGKNLFEYELNGALKINLVYDYRQEATDKLKNLGLTINDKESSYNTLKGRYELYKSQYNSLNLRLESDIATYEQKRKAYEQQVSHWNSQGGAPKHQADKLNKDREELQALASQIAQEQNQLNVLVDNINALAAILNRLANELNLNVAHYNDVGQSRGEEFEEGLYTKDSSGESIDIYEFSTESQLVRVLAHELGHALGLEHIESNPEAIMYYLNQAKNEKATVEDILAVKQLCSL